MLLEKHGAKSDIKDYLMSLFRQIIILLLASLTLAAISYAVVGNVDIAKENEITLATALGKANVLWVDARGADAYESAHIPEAILLNEDDWDNLIVGLLDRWRPDVTVVVYCSSSACNASQSVAQRLTKDFEFNNIYVLKDGWHAWQNRENSK